MPLSKRRSLALLAVQLALPAWGLAYAGWRLARSGAMAAVDCLVLALICEHVLLSVLLWRSTARKRAEQDCAADLAQQLNQALRKSETLIKTSSDLIWEIDADGRFTFISDHNSIMGPDWGIRVGMSVHELPERDPVTTGDVWREQFASNARGEPFSNFHYSLRRSDGTVSHFCVNGIPVHSETGALAGYRGTTRDRSKEIETLQILQHQSLHDALTGLPNRRAVMIALEDRLQDALRSALPLAVLLCDIDRFKTINDHCGHQVGDHVLSLFGERLGCAITAGESAGRYGGEEFLVILSGDAARVIHRSNEIRAVVTRPPYVLDDGQHKVTASGGLAFMRPSDTAATLIARADLALYQAKQNGRDRIELEQDETAASRDIELKRDLRAAACSGEFSLDFQPVIDVARGVVTSCEALLRWNSPGRGRVPPGDFIPFAERNGLMAEIDAWVLRAACREATGWRDQIRVLVNLSSAHFHQHGLVELISGVLAETGLQPNRLELEVTETAMIVDVNAAADVLGRLRALGISIALDDFGTGYSSLSFLRVLPFDRIKIDRSFVQDLGNKPEAAAIIGGVIHLCTSMGASVTAEGVETSQQIRLLREIGCREIQGFGVGLPAPASQIRAWLDAFATTSAATEMSGHHLCHEHAA